MENEIRMPFIRQNCAKHKLLGFQLSSTIVQEMTTAGKFLSKENENCSKDCVKANTKSYDDKILICAEAYSFAIKSFLPYRKRSHILFYFFNFSILLIFHEVGTVQNKNP